MQLTLQKGSYVNTFTPPSKFMNFQEAFEVANKISFGIMPIVYISIWDYTATGRNGFASLLHTHFASQGFPYRFSDGENKGMMGGGAHVFLSLCLRFISLFLKC